MRIIICLLSLFLVSGLAKQEAVWTHTGKDVQGWPTHLAFVQFALYIDGQEPGPNSPVPADQWTSPVEHTLGAAGTWIEDLKNHVANIPVNRYYRLFVRVQTIWGQWSSWTRADNSIDLMPPLPPEKVTNQ